MTVMAFNTDSLPFASPDLTVTVRDLNPCTVGIVVNFKLDISTSNDISAEKMYISLEIF
jgi:hypothetical protein